MTAVDRATSIRLTTGGPLDSHEGPYDSIAAACAAISNTVDGNGVNFRLGKKPMIRINGTLVQYWWPSGRYGDADLVKVVDPPDPKIKEWSAAIYTAGSQVFYGGKIYESNTATVAADVPGTSAKWVEKVGSDKSSWVVKRTRADIFSSITWQKDRSFNDDARSIKTDNGWNTSVFVQVKAGQKVSAYLRGLSTRIMAAFYSSNSFDSFVSIIGKHNSSTGLTNKKFDYNIAANGYIVFSYAYVNYTANDLYINIEDNNGIDQIINAQDLDKKVSDVNNKWLTQTGNDQIMNKIRWTDTAFIAGSTITQNQNGWRYSEFYPVKTGDLLEINLRGDTGRIIGGLYSTQDLSSFITSLGSFPNPLSSQPLYNTKAFYEVNQDGFVAFNNRFYQYDKDDLYIKIIRTGLLVDANAQYLYNLMGTDNVEIPKAKFVQIERPKFASIHFYGAMPTDASVARRVTPGTMKIKVDGKTVFQANQELSVQGHGSALLAKKGFTLDLFNYDYDGLKLKIGDIVATDSWHLKAYYTDRTHTRDVACGRIWRDMINTLDYPESKVNNKVFALNTNPKEADAYIADAKYHTDGLPVAVYVYDTFYGLYTLRTKKARENYALDNANKKHIFLDSGTYTALLSKTFDGKDWEIKSPKMTGYEDLGPVPDAEVLANINRLFSFTATLNSSYANHADYIVLNHWIIWIIFSELISNRDTNGNNYNIITWDGTHWTIIPYDMDLTLGLNPWSGTGTYVIDPTRPQFDINHDIWATFKTRYITQIKAMYTKLRNDGFISTSNLQKYFNDQIKEVPRKVYEDDRAIWPLLFTDGEPTIEQIILFLDSKIKFLDTQWLNP